jgi:hypothetical protein
VKDSWANLCSLKWGAASRVLAISVLTLAQVFGEELIPTAPGTSWNYEMIQRNMSNSLDLNESTKPEHLSVSYRIGGTLKTDNNEFIKLELYRGNALASTDLINVDDRGITCSARIDEKGSVSTFDPPQILLRAPLKTRANWKFDGQIGGTKVNQHYEVADEETVAVPAGKFRAWHISCQQTLPTPATVDRWFVPGTGFVKVVSKAKAPSGGVLQEMSLELKEAPKIAIQPTVDVAIEKEKLSVGLSKAPVGEFATVFSSDTPAIYARWQGRGLRAQAKIRAVWIAENVSDVAPDYQIDEASTVAPTPNSHGTFTISQPDTGWASGTYRVEFYVDAHLAQKLRLTITKE